MCGIFGTTLKYGREVIDRKLSRMRFRGPDYTGVAQIPTRGGGDELTFGHVRLSIIDLDLRSNQPFRYNDHISIVFNGEVYNYKELRKEHLAGTTLRTESDTEVICAMYDRYGADCVKHFNGMFAYVIYDSRTNVLVGARDRLGKKPFYYIHDQQGFEFASQIQVLQPGRDLHIDETARQLYLLQGYIPDPYCIYREVKKLRAGECFTYSLDSKRMEVKTYWNLFDNSCGFQAPKSYAEAKETVHELLADAVRLRIHADVPVGMFLSGGIDSSLVCALVSRLNKNICAYTIGFEGTEFDESQHARAVAQHLGIPIKVSQCSGADQQRIFDDYINYFDEPFADPSMIPSSLVAEKARQDVTVVLGGDGGDEEFFGYTKYLHIMPRLKQYEKPYWLRRLMVPYFRYKGGARNATFATQRDYADVFRSEGIFVYDFRGAERFNRLKLAELIPDRGIFRPERGILAYSDYDMKFFMNAVNQKVDRATMRCSLELRNPIMDYRVAEYSRLLPLEYLYTPERGLKSMLKDILYDYVPRELLERPKRGFTPPTATWFRSSLREKLTDMVNPESVQSLLPELDTNHYIALRDRFLQGEKMDARMFWSVYTYINWYNHYAKS